MHLRNASLAPDAQIALDELQKEKRQSAFHLKTFVVQIEAIGAPQGVV